MPQKPYDLRFEVRETYVHAFVSGIHDSFEISFAYWCEIMDELTKLGIAKALVVEDIAEQTPMVDIYKLVSRLSEIAPRDVTVAFVDRYSSHQELNNFGILIGSNRGISCRAFDGESEAEAWLLAQ